MDIQSKLSMVHIGDCDKVIWILNSSAKFTCADSWQHLRVKQIEVNWWKLVWFTNAIPKHSFIGWLTIRNRLVTKDRLLQWGLGVDPMCLFCRQNLEDRDHLFFKCPFTNQIWKNIMALCLVSDARMIGTYLLIGEFSSLRGKVFELSSARWLGGLRFIISGSTETLFCMMGLLKLRSRFSN